MNKPVIVASLLLVVAPIAVQNLLADERDDRIRTLERRVEQLEKLLQAPADSAFSGCDLSKRGL